MDWFSLLVGAGIAATAYSSGRGVGFYAGRRKERAKVATGPELICSCRHGYGQHETGGKCHAETKRADKWDHYNQPCRWEYVPCPCRSYDGPEPLANVLAWRLPGELPPTK